MFVLRIFIGINCNECNHIIYKLKISNIITTYFVKGSKLYFVPSDARYDKLQLYNITITKQYMEGFKYLARGHTLHCTEQPYKVSSSRLYASLLPSSFFFFSFFTSHNTAKKKERKRKKAGVKFQVWRYVNVRFLNSLVWYKLIFFDMFKFLQTYHCGGSFSDLFAIILDKFLFLIFMTYTCSDTVWQTKLAYGRNTQGYNTRI